jgi:hypothetical protein
MLIFVGGEGARCNWALRNSAPAGSLLAFSVATISIVDICKVI